MNSSGPLEKRRFHQSETTTAAEKNTRAVINARS